MNKVKYTHPVLPPSLYVSRIDGKTYIVPGWKEVSSKTTLKDIKWVKEKVISLKNEVETFEFKSSSSSEIYITKKFKNIDGSVKYSCNCPGSWRTRGNCKHVQQLKQNG